MDTQKVIADALYKEATAQAWRKRQAAYARVKAQADELLQAARSKADEIYQAEVEAAQKQREMHEPWEPRKPKGA